MNRQNPLARALNVEPGEGRPLTFLMIHAFFVGITQVTFFTASNALFLVEFSAETLPFVYMVSAVVSTLTGGIYATFERRLSIQSLLTITLLFLLISVSAFRLSIELTGSKWPAFGLMVWFVVLRALLNVELWGLSGRLFNVRQGKRLFGLVGSGELIASVIGGFSTPLFVRLFGTPNLLWACAVGLVLSIATLVLLARLFGARLADQESAEEDSHSRSSFVDLFRSRYISFIFLLAFVLVTAQYFIDYSFLDQTNLRYQEEDDLARFFGLFFGVVEGITFIFLTFVTGRIIGRFGIRIGMRVRPVVLFFCAVGMLVTSAVFGPLAFFFWIAVGTKMLDQVLTRALSEPAFLVLYQPLRPERKLAVQVAVESMIFPIGIGFAGALLFLMRWIDYLQPITLAVCILLTVVAWLSVGARVSRGYREALARALNRRMLEGTSLSLDESTILDVLQARLKSPHAGEVIYALDLLEKWDVEEMQAVLIDLLQHPSPEVRKDVLARMQRVNFVSALPSVEDLFEREEVSDVKSAALGVICEFGEAQAVDYIAPYLEHEDQEVRLGALAGLLRSGGIDGILLAGNHLNSLANSSDPARRTFAARVLGDVGIRNFYRPLLKLLEDDDPSVRRSALAAAGAIKNTRLWPLVIPNLASITFHTQAALALAAAGDSALSEMEVAFAEPDATRQLRIRIADVCGRIKGRRATTILQRWLDEPDKGIRSKVLSSLHQCDYRAEEGEVIDVRRLIRGEVSDAALTLATMVDLKEDSPAIERACEHEIGKIRKRIFLFLSFIYESQAILRAEENLLQDSVDQRAYALEVIDTTLAQDLKGILFPLLEDLDPETRLRRLEIHFPQEHLTTNERLEELITRQGRWVNPWLRACALHAIADLPGETSADTVLSALDDPDPLVRETSAWSFYKLDREAFASHLDTLRSDPSHLVTQIAERLQEWKEGDPPMLLTIEKVMVLKSVSIFSGVPDEVLADLASLMEEMEIPKETCVYDKGDPGGTMYIIVDGGVRVHDGDRTFVNLGERDFFGELTTLDPEPQMAAVTANEDTRLLGLNGDVLYELMSDHAEVLRGIIQVLCKRLRCKKTERW